jgi:hypothetical protein
MRNARRRDLALCALCFAATGAVTYAGVFFVPALAICVGWRQGWRRAAHFASIAGAAALAVIAIHALWSAHSLARLGLESQPLLSRARELWAPLFDGTHPLGEWTRLQGERLGEWFTWPIVLVALVGLALHGVAAMRRRRVDGTTPDTSAIDLEPALLVGGALYLLAFYRHTLDPQFPFLMLLSPGIAGLAALALERGAERIGNSRVRWAALTIACGALVILAALRANELRFDFRADEQELSRGQSQQMLPLPDVTGRELAALVPAGGFGIHPACVGLNTAVSFYAWRSLWAANDAADRQPEFVAQRFGLGAAPHVLLLPKHPWPSIAAQIAQFETDLVQNSSPDRESEHWRAWDLH